MLNSQWEKIKRFAKGEEVGFFVDLKMFIFGDFKKYMFKYFTLSPAIAVENYKVLSTKPVC